MLRYKCVVLTNLILIFFFCRSSQVKSFVDQSADYQGICHRGSVGQWSPDDLPTVGWCFEEIFIMISAEGLPNIGHLLADDHQTVHRWHFIKYTHRQKLSNSKLVLNIKNVSYQNIGNSSFIIFIWLYSSISVTEQMYYVTSVKAGIYWRGVCFFTV